MASQASTCEIMPHDTEADLDEKDPGHFANSGSTDFRTMEQATSFKNEAEDGEKPSIEQMARKAVVAISGGALVVVGIPLIPLPGPGCLVVAGGMSILASEFPAARKVLDKGKEKLEVFAEKKDEEVSDELGLGFTIVDDPNAKQSQASHEKGVEKLRCMTKYSIEKLRYVTKNTILPLMSKMESGSDRDIGAAEEEDDKKSCDKRFWELSY